ncbi:MAG TPA: glycoside hydrolase family 3 N-terminal domain-containing protein [Gemmatimonadales bacterium]|nr:glycoside hydrolase family 3 N-terminal domain-containing protein [Gemmatimonadales bacterium]
MSADVGRLILPALRWRPGSGFAHEDGAIRAALELGAGGFVVFGGPAILVRALAADLVRRAGRPLLVAADLERGAGQQFEPLTELPPPAALASLGDLDLVRWAGAVTGAEARSLGVNWVFAPVADLDLLPDNPIVQTRAFSADPSLVAECVRAWVEGCRSVGALSCVKHFPGHGRTTTDSHAMLPVVEASAAELRATDLRPFAAAVAGGVPAVMTAHVAYPALDPSGLPATRSSPILGLLRRELGFDGLVITDALIMDGAVAGVGEGEASVEAVRAGVDLLLYPKDVHAVRDALEGALADGTLARPRVEEALGRYARALAFTQGPYVGPRPGPYESAAHVADALLDRGLDRGLARGWVRRLRAPLELVPVDDDLDGPYPPSPSGYVGDALAGRGLLGAGGGAKIVLAFAEPRAWKGRAGFGADAREALVRAAPGAALVVLFGHPRLVDEIPAGPPVLVAWHRQRLMQEAVARWLAART